MTTQIILQFKGNETEKEIYRLILSNLEQMIVGVGDNVDLLAKLVTEFQNRLAQASNSHYRALCKSRGETWIVRNLEKETLPV
jgi:hypothetical protein